MHDRKAAISFTWNKATFLVGGRNLEDRGCSDLYYHFRGKWSKRTTTGEVPSVLKSSWSTAQVIGDILYVFHGRREREEHAPISTLDLISWNWTTLRPEGIPPPYPLVYFSSWIYQEKIYIFGGMALSKDYERQHLRNDFLYYDISTNRWEWPAVSGAIPSPRCFHTTVISGTDMYLFGGGSEHDCLNDLHRLDMLEMEFSLVHPSSEDEDDYLPTGRCYHTMTLISPKAAVVFGGEDEREGVLGDCWLLDLDAAKQPMWEVTSLWKRYWCHDPCRPDEDDKRSEHSAVLEPESQRLWIMGGMSDDVTKEMLVVQFDEQREPTPLRMLAMEWVIDGWGSLWRMIKLSKNDQGLQDLPRDLMEELESRRSWFYKQRRYDCEACGRPHSYMCGHSIQCCPGYCVCGSNP